MDKLHKFGEESLWQIIPIVSACLGIYFLAGTMNDRTVAELSTVIALFVFRDGAKVAFLVMRLLLEDVLFLLNIVCNSSFLLVGLLQAWQADPSYVVVQFTQIERYVF